MPLLSWIRLIDVHQNAVFEMGKNRWRARVTENRCNCFCAAAVVVAFAQICCKIIS